MFRDYPAKGVGNKPMVPEMVGLLLGGRYSPISRETASSRKAGDGVAAIFEHK